LPRDLEHLNARSGSDPQVASSGSKAEFFLAWA